MLGRLKFRRQWLETVKDQQIIIQISVFVSIIGGQLFRWGALVLLGNVHVQRQLQDFFDLPLTLVDLRGNPCQLFMRKQVNYVHIGFRFRLVQTITPVHACEFKEKMLGLNTELTTLSKEAATLEKQIADNLKELFG